MRPMLSAVILATLVGCGDDDSPTAPGDELVGTWISVSTTDADQSDFSGVLMTIRADGTLTQSFTVEGITVTVEGTWEIVGGKLISVFTGGGETEQFTESYTLRGDRLTLVDDEDGTVEIWERRS